MTMTKEDTDSRSRYAGVHPDDLGSIILGRDPLDFYTDEKIAVLTWMDEHAEV